MKKGFTLVEVMIVVAIIALLAAIAIPNVLRSRVSTNQMNAQAVLNTISTACENYSNDNAGSYPTAISDLTGATPPYLNQDYTAATQSGYTIACDTLAAGSYSCTATPTTCGTTGSNTYTITTGGVLTSAAC